MAGKKEEVKTQTIEGEVEELKKDLMGILSRVLPPKEVREEVVRNLYRMELSFLKIIKTLVDYKVQRLEEVSKESAPKKSKKIDIE